MLLRWNVLLCFWATVSALVCLVCSSTFVRIIYGMIIVTKFEIDRTIRCQVIPFDWYRHCTWSCDLDLLTLDSGHTWLLTWSNPPPSLTTLFSAVLEISLEPPQYKMGHLTWPRPFYGWFIVLQSFSATSISTRIRFWFMSYEWRPSRVFWATTHAPYHVTCA